LTDSEANARKYSFMLLSYRGRSEKELRERLEKKGFSGRHIAGTLIYLKQAGLLDDHALALDLKRQAFHNKLLGYAGARSFLISRGVPDDIVDTSLTYDEEAEVQKIQKLIDKKLKSMGDYSDKKNARRLRDFLARKGYSYSAIRTALRNRMKFEEEE
jgi:regulatory protein